MPPIDVAGHAFLSFLDDPGGHLGILIQSGDFMVDGRSIEEIDDFDLWLGSLPLRHKLVIAGNHDTLFDRNPKLAGLTSLKPRTFRTPALAWRV